MGVECLNGKLCSRVYQHYPGNCTFEFDEASLAVDTPWRVMDEGKVVLTSRDHGQQFGLPAPVDVFSAAASLLQGRQGRTVRLTDSSGSCARIRRRSTAGDRYRFVGFRAMEPSRPWRASGCARWRRCGRLFA